MGCTFLNLENAPKMVLHDRAGEQYPLCKDGSQNWGLFAHRKYCFHQRKFTIQVKPWEYSKKGGVSLLSFLPSDPWADNS